MILDVDDKNEKALFEALRKLDSINSIRKLNDPETSQALKDLEEAFEDVKLHQSGQKNLKSAKDLLDEL